jgi:hypothetical protein
MQRILQIFIVLSMGQGGTKFKYSRAGGRIREFPIILLSGPQQNRCMGFILR